MNPGYTLAIRSIDIEFYEDGKINYSLYIVTGLVISTLLTHLFRIEGGRKSVVRIHASAKAA